MSIGSVADKRMFLQRMAEAQSHSQDSKSRRTLRRTVGGLVALAVLSLLGLWFLGLFTGTPKEVLEIRALVDQQIVELEKVARNEAPLSYDTAGFRQNWDRMREMPREVRDQARREMERLFEARERAELRSYFTMPPQERQKELDRRIRAEEERRRSWQQRAAQAGRPPGRGGPGGRGAGGPQAAVPGGRQGGAPASATAGDPPGGGRPGGGPPGGGRTGGRTEEGRNNRAKQRIDSTSPEQRSQSAEYRRAMEARRAQLGLPTGRSRGG